MLGSDKRSPWIQWFTLFLLTLSTKIHGAIGFNANTIILKEYDGGRNWSAFVKLWSNENHFVWWDSGLIVDGSTLGYRSIVKRPYLNQHWFWGSYFAYDWYGTCAENLENMICRRGQGVYRVNLGIELFGSRFGRLSINAYQLPVKSDKVDAIKVVIPDLSSKPWMKFYPLTIVDDGGVSIKWLSIPHQSSVQASTILARSWIKRRNNGWSTECVNRLGVGLEYVVFKGLRVEMQYMFLDTYQKGWHISFRNLSNDKQPSQYHINWLKQLNSPADRHIPIYRGLHITPPSGSSGSYGRFADTNSSDAGESVESKFAKLTHQTVEDVRNCSAKQLRAWYHRASLELHPDKQSGKSTVEIAAANERFTQLNNYYHTLLNDKT